MRKSAAVLAVTVLAGACIAANAQCVNGQMSYQQQSTCDCTGKVDFPGGCQNSIDNVSCVVESFYSCGRKGTENCTIAFTATRPGACGNGGDVVKQLSAASISEISGQERARIRALRADVSQENGECARTADAFRAWLAAELAKKEGKASQGAE